MLPTGDPLTAKYTHGLKVKSEGMEKKKMREWKKIFHANGNDKKAGVAIPIADIIDFKAKIIFNKI